MMKKILMWMELMLLSAAVFLTSCSKEESVSVDPERIGSVLIAPPAETKVEISDNGSKVSIAGWTLGDKVTMIKIMNSSTFKAAEFTCTDAEAGLFSGTLPEGVENVSEFSMAAFNCTDFRASGGEVIYTSLNRISTDLKGSVVMFAKKDGNGGYKMKIVNNILKITNDTQAAIPAGIKAQSGAMCLYIVPYYDSDSSLQYSPGASNAGGFDNASFVVPKGTSYVVMPSSEKNFSGHKFGLCLSTDALNAASLVPFKSIPSIGKIYTYTIAAK